MEETKVWWKSKTLIGLVISILGKVGAMYFGIDIVNTDLTTATDAAVAVVNSDTIAAAISLLVGFGGDAWAWYGRVKATKTIGKV